MWGNWVSLTWKLRVVGDGCEGDRPVSGTMADRGQGSASVDDFGAYAPGTGSVAILLLVQGWTAAEATEVLERDPHTIGRWAAASARAVRWP